jgi:two-component system CheB/CheR fusion protein
MANLAQNDKPFYIVGIGASAGGLNALEQFFDNMPSDSGMAFVVIQHLSPDFKSQMESLLAHNTDMPIHTVADNTALEPNSVYLLPSMALLAVKDGKLHLIEIEKAGTLSCRSTCFSVRWPRRQDRGLWGGYVRDRQGRFPWYSG